MAELNVSPELLELLRAKATGESETDEVPLPAIMIREREEWRKYVSGRQEAPSPATVPAPSPSARPAASIQRAFDAIASWVVARPALTVGIVANIIVIAALFAALRGLSGPHKALDHRLNTLTQDLAKLDAAHNAMIAQIEIERHLADFKENVETMPSEERKQKIGELIAEARAFLEKYPAHRTPEIDELAAEASIAIDNVDKSRQRIDHLERVERKFVSFRRMAADMTPDERKRQSEQLVGEYKALTEQNRSRDALPGTLNARKTYIEQQEPPKTPPSKDQ